MTMTIRQIADQVLPEIGLDVTNFDATDTDFQTRQIVALLNSTGQDINKRVEWTEADRSSTIPGSVNSFDLPSDLQRIKVVTLNKSVNTPVRPAESDATWKFVQDENPAQKYYFVRRGTIKFQSNLDTDGATMRYVSTYWLGDRETINDNTNEPIFDGQLVVRGAVWRWRRQKGLPYEDLMAEFEADLEAAALADKGV